MNVSSIPYSRCTEWKADTWLTCWEGWTIWRTSELSLLLKDMHYVDKTKPLPFCFTNLLEQVGWSTDRTEPDRGIRTVCNCAKTESHICLRTHSCSLASFSFTLNPVLVGYFSQTCWHLMSTFYLFVLLVGILLKCKINKTVWGYSFFLSYFSCVYVSVLT